MHGRLTRVDVKDFSCITRAGIEQIRQLLPPGTKLLTRGRKNRHDCINERCIYDQPRRNEPAGFTRGYIPDLQPA